MRKKLQDMFNAAVAAADPALALRPHLNGFETEGDVIIVSVGKAATAMAEEALTHFPNATGLIVTNAENEREIDGLTTYVAGHPVPDAGGLAAGKAVIETLQKAGDTDTILALISGGGSAMLPAPVDGISMDDKSEVSRQLLAAGVDITEMNLVRQQLSQIKGGGFLKFAAPALVKAYILSDVIGDDLRAVASGPTVAPIGTRSDARNLLKSCGCWETMPQSVKTYLSQDDVETHIPTAQNTMIGSNRQSLQAACDSVAGAVIVDDNLIGDVGDAAKKIIAATQSNTTDLMIFGGETTVILTGDGKGGRNQELALRVAIEAEKANLTGWTFLSGGTDGRDGPTDAAGAIVDDGTLDRIRAKADVEKLLQNNDSNHALNLAGDLLITGGTGTNVADIQIMIRT